MKWRVARLAPDVCRKIIEAALSRPAEEVCGLLGGEEDEIRTVYPVSNIDPCAQEAFLLDPRQQIDAMRTMRKSGETLRGIYHSHPDTDAVPSETDLRLAAYPDVYYLIVSLRTSSPELRGYYFDGKDFTRSRIVTC